MEYHVLSCPNRACTATLRVPKGRGKLSVTCPKCKKQFLFDSNTGKIEKDMIGKSPKAVDKGTAQKMMRRLLFVYDSESTGTALRKVGNFLAKNAPLKIIADGKQVGTMVDRQDTVVELSSDVHTVCMSNSGIPSVVALNAKVSGSAIKIPAGMEDYIVFVEKEGNTYYLRAGLVNDSFVEGLKAHIKMMCEGKGVLERLHMPQNRNHTLYLRFEPAFFTLEWDIHHTKGLKQWSTGRDGEKVYYSSLGLIPPQKQPGGYWEYVRLMVSEEINTLEDLQCTSGGVISEKSMHRLF